MNLDEFIKDLRQIENILLKCYGKNGKSALIQSNSNSDSDASFALTNDGIKILNCMSFKDNHVLILLVETIRKHSSSCGDNCKTLFIYVLTMLEVLFSSNKEFSSLIDCKEILNTFKTINLAEVYEEFVDSWSNDDHQLIKINTKEKFLTFLPTFCVLNDLNNYNKILSSLAVQLAINLIKSYLNKEEIGSSIESNLRDLLNDLDYILVYSDKFSLDESKLFNNGFIIESNSLNTINIKSNSNMNGLFLVLNENNVNQTSKQIEIKSNLNESILNSFYSEKVNYFSKDFLEKLKSNNIKIIFTNGCLNDLQRSQLNSIDIELVSYLDKYLVEFLCTRIGIQSIEIDLIENTHKQIDNDYLKANSFCLDSIVNIENNKINFFSLSEKSINLNYVYFSSPMKSNFNQFKSYLIKLIKTLLNGFQNINLINTRNINMQNKLNINLLLIKCSKFEEISINLTESLGFNYRSLNNNKPKFIIYNYLHKCFKLLDMKLNNFKNTNEFLHEPFNLKLECFMKSLQFTQNIIKIDKVYLVHKRISKTDIGSDSD